MQNWKAEEVEGGIKVTLAELKEKVTGLDTQEKSN